MLQPIPFNGPRGRRIRNQAPNQPSGQRTSNEWNTVLLLCTSFTLTREVLLSKKNGFAFFPFLFSFFFFGFGDFGWSTAGILSWHKDCRVSCPCPSTDWAEMVGNAYKLERWMIDPNCGLKTFRSTCLTSETLQGILESSSATIGSGWLRLFSHCIPFWEAQWHSIGCLFLLN